MPLGELVELAGGNIRVEVVLRDGRHLEHDLRVSRGDAPTLQSSTQVGRPLMSMKETFSEVRSRPV